MLNKIIHFSLNNRLIVLAMAAAILLAGMWQLMRTDIDIFPDLNAPQVVIMTEAPGMAPEEVEQLVTYPIETAVNGAMGVSRVRSKSATGFSAVTVEFDWDTDVYLARQIVSEKLTEMSADLPPGVKAPVLGPQSSILGEMMIIGLTADSTTTLMQLRTLAERQLRPRILALGGVAQVSVIGGDEEQYQILLDPARMRAYNVGMEQVMGAIKDLSTNSSGGIRYDYGNEYLIKAEINTANPDDLAQSYIAPGVRLADIATVAIGGGMPRLGVASVRTRPAVLMTVTKQPHAPTVDLTKKIDQTLEQARQSLPADVSVTTDIFRQSDFITTSISNLQTSLLEGALMVIIVLFFFLFNLRTTLISLVALPLSVIITVLILNAMGYGINTMSLGGIAIAIGSLVDDAIVDVENVYKRLRQNAALPADQRLSTLKVVYQASAEVRLPIFNSSLIIIAGFLPLFFLSGIEGRMLKPLGISFIVALVASTIVALTLTPVLCSYLRGQGKDGQAKQQPRFARWIVDAYSRSLAWALAHGRALLIATAVLFVGAMALMFTLGRGFLPHFNEGSFTINVATMPGIALDQSDSIGRYAERLILQTPEVKTTARKTGRAELDEHALGANESEIEVPYVLDQGRSRSEVATELRHRLSQIPGVAIEVGQPISHRIDAMLSGTEAQIAIKIFGDNLGTLYQIGQQIQEIAHTIPGLVDVNLEQQIERPQLVVRPRRQAMAALGVTPSALADAVRIGMEGEEVSQVYRDGLPYPLVVKINPAVDIADIMVDGADGKQVPITQVADIVSTLSPNTILRENAHRRLVLSANIEGGDMRGAVNALQQAVNAQVTMPEGYYVTYGGQFESEARASRTLLLASLGALLVILLLLYYEFKNWRQALIILINMPLAMIGGVLLLVVTGAELNIPAIIGFIALLGITTRNGMLLMSRYNKLASAGVNLDDRIARGSADRFLPIIMTALTSALALIPLALRGQEPGNEIQAPLAIVILGGLISATALNIYIVPIIYRGIFRKRQNS